MVTWRPKTRQPWVVLTRQARRIALAGRLEEVRDTRVRRAIQLIERLLSPVEDLAAIACEPKDCWGSHFLDYAAQRVDSRKYPGAVYFFRGVTDRPLPCIDAEAVVVLAESLKAIDLGGEAVNVSLPGKQLVRCIRRVVSSAFGSGKSFGDKLPDEVAGVLECAMKLQTALLEAEVVVLREEAVKRLLRKATIKSSPDGFAVGLSAKLSPHELAGKHGVANGRCKLALSVGDVTMTPGTSRFPTR